MSNEPNYSFSDEKNAYLKAERGIGFDDVIFCIENGYILDVINNTSEKYSHQIMYIVEVTSVPMFIKLVSCSQ